MRINVKQALALSIFDDQGVSALAVEPYKHTDGRFHVAFVKKDGEILDPTSLHPKYSLEHSFVWEQQDSSGGVIRTFEHKEIVYFSFVISDVTPSSGNEVIFQ